MEGRSDRGKEGRGGSKTKKLMDQQAKDKMERGSLLELNTYFLSYLIVFIKPFNTL